MVTPPTNIILVLGDVGEDEHAAFVADRLRDLGHDVESIDSRWFPQQMQLSFDPVAGDGTVALPTGRTIAWSDIRSVYWRCYNGVLAPVLADDEQSQLAQNDSRAAFEAFLQNLPARWVNGWDAFWLHQCKPAALARLAGLDLAPLIQLPATCITNDPQVARDFADRADACIFKPVQGGAHTQKLTAAELDSDQLDKLQFAPVTFQQYIDGDDIRVFVAGSRVLACTVRTQAVDFRNDPHAPIEPIDLPEPLADACRRIAAALHLRWTGIDLRRTPDDEYWFLEANPSPMFLGFETATGLPLGDALIELLCED